MNKLLSDKIEYSLKLLKKGERLALGLNEQGYFVAFSGGKDSQVLLELVKMSGVRYHAHYNITGNDPPENVYFIREHYKEVQFIHPKENYFRLVERKGLPTRLTRFCCERLKEGTGAGNVVLTGVRREESLRRSKYDEFDIMSRRKEHRESTVKKTMEEVMEMNHRCIKGKDAIMLRPILEWTEQDVWDFIRLRGIPVNPCYELVGRVGCMFCPFSSKKNIALYEERYPKFLKLFKKSLQSYLDKKETDWKDANECYEWWKSKTSVEQWREKKQQLEMRFQ